MDRIKAETRELVRELRLLNLFYVNDIKDADRMVIQQKVETNTQFSFSFIILLIVSSIVSTLGLIQNSPAVIIGGMIISPLMWPLMKISLGVSTERKSYLKQAASLLILSVLISIISAFLISSLSTIKHLSNEILARTTPTVLDIFVALAAGVIAAMALVQKKISDSLAGVAVATSLMPPLCVAGIGLSLFSLPTFMGGFLLFLANVVSIIFASILVFMLVGVKRDSQEHLRFKGIVTISMILLITAIPLIIAMKNYSFKVNAFDKIQRILTTEFKIISPDIYVQNVKTDLETEKLSGALHIDAELLIPEDLVINYQQKEEIISRLEESLGKKIDLKLQIQKTINLASERDLATGDTKNQLIKTLREEISKINLEVTVDTIEVSRSEKDKVWIVNSTLRSDPSSQLSENDRVEIENELSDKIGDQVNLNIDIISRLQLISQPDLENDLIKKDIHTGIFAISPDIDLVSIKLTILSVVSTEIVDTAESEGNSPTDKVFVTIDLRVPQKMDLPSNDIEELKAKLTEKYKKGFEFKINIIEKNVLLFPVGTN